MQNQPMFRNMGWFVWSAANGTDGTTILLTDWKLYQGYLKADNGLLWW